MTQRQTLALQAAYAARDELGTCVPEELHLAALRRFRRLLPGATPELRERLLRGAFVHMNQSRDLRWRRGGRTRAKRG